MPPLTFILAACSTGPPVREAPPTDVVGAGTHAPAGFALELEHETLRFRWAPAHSDVTDLFLLEQADSDAPVQRVARLDRGETTIGLDVPLFQRLDATFQLEVCTGTVCERSETVALPRDLSDVRGRVHGPPPDGEVGFGRAVAISADGDTLAVGSPGTSSGTGSVHMYHRTTDGWRAAVPLRPHATGPSSASFGRHVVLDAEGDIAVVAGVTDDTYRCALSVPHIYVRQSAVWTLEADLAELLPDHDLPWADISDDGRWLVATARPYGPDCTAGTWRWLRFERQFGRWRLVDEVPLDDGRPEQITMSGNGQVVTMRLDPADRDAAPYVGVWEQRAESWIQSARLEPAPDRYTSRFGLALDADHTGSLIAVGDSSDHPLDPPSQSGGAVTLFSRQADGRWTQEAFLAPSGEKETDFGWAVTLDGSGEWLAVGAPDVWSTPGRVPLAEEPPNGWIMGAVWVYARAGGRWTQRTVIRTPAEDVGQLSMGRAIAFDGVGDTLVVAELRTPLVDTGIWFPADDIVPEASVVWIY